MSAFNVKKSFIANKIKMLREKTGWSQSDLAKKADVTSAAISQIESLKRMPSLTVCRKIADAFNVTLAELTGDEVNNKADEEILTFFRKYKDINELPSEDQEMLQSLIERLKKNHE